MCRWDPLALHQRLFAETRFRSQKPAVQSVFLLPCDRLLPRHFPPAGTFHDVAAAVLHYQEAAVATPNDELVRVDGGQAHVLALVVVTRAFALEAEGRFAAARVCLGEPVKVREEQPCPSFAVDDPRQCPLHELVHDCCAKPVERKDDDALRVNAVPAEASKHPVEVDELRWCLALHVVGYRAWQVRIVHSAAAWRRQRAHFVAQTFVLGEQY